MSTVKDASRSIQNLATETKHTKWLCPLLLAADAALCAVIILKIPYTEVDWTAYMEQVKIFLGGERDYIKIKGGTGPLVYPGAHVYTYAALFKLTDEGTDILRGQIIFALVYLATLALVMSCYRMAKAPPYIFPLLVLSKRLHSIYMLRMFNDCFAVGALFAAIYAYQKRMWSLGSILYSWGVATKMSLLLSSPAVGVILLQAGLPGGVFQVTVIHALLMGLVQILTALPFLLQNPTSYVSRAFEFTRVFMFRWTVNWRFVGQDVFLSREFALALLAAHISVLCIFIFTRWLRPSGSTLREALKTITSERSTNRIVAKHQISPEFILTTMLTANSIGMLCARSLHYQFYSWLAWGTPFLLWRSGFHPIVQYVLWGSQEWAWNVYPSTDLSSQVVVGVLAITVIGVWWSTGKTQMTQNIEKVKSSRKTPSRRPKNS